MVAPTGSARAPEPRSALWMELFFDLIFAAFITQLALGLHGDPGWVQFAIFAGLYIPTWWAWVNMMLTINVATFVSERGISFVLLLGTFFVGMMVRRRGVEVLEDAARGHTGIVVAAVLGQVALQAPEQTPISNHPAVFMMFRR